jgi:hypothetical protein
MCLVGLEELHDNATRFRLLLDGRPSSASDTAVATMAIPAPAALIAF